MFERPRMSRKTVTSAAAPNESVNAVPLEKSTYAPPKLVKLLPGTAKHARARAAFDLLLGSKDNEPGDP